MLGAASTFARIQFKRHIGNPMLWGVALAAPIAARFMVPEQSDTYTVIAINNAYPVLTSAVIGMELGIIAALLLSPLIYIFLRVSRIKTTPWQVEDVTPAQRSAQMFGHWIADTAIIWMLLFGLALSGVILAYFRLPIESVNPFHTVMALMTIAAPAFAFIAALRLFFSARPLLRGAWGDVMFFILWMMGIVMGSVFFYMDSSAIVDLFGYAAPMKSAVAVPIDMFVVGSAPQTTDTIIVEPLKGILTVDFLVSRLFWIGIAALVAIMAGFVFKPRKPKTNSRKKWLAAFAPLFSFFETLVQALLPKRLAMLSPLSTHISQLMRPGLIVALALIIAGAGAVLPFRTIIGPALVLVMLFPLTRQSGAWQNRTLLAFTDTLPTNRQAQLIWQISANIVVMSLLCLPSLIRMILTGSHQALLDIAIICSVMPIIIAVLGYLTRSGVTPRLLGLMAWYMYLNA